MRHADLMHLSHKCSQVAPRNTGHGPWSPLAASSERWGVCPITHYPLPITHYPSRVLSRQRIRPHLELHHLRPRLLEALAVKHGAVGAGRPHPAALPAPAGVVDAPFAPLREEAHRVR